LKKLIVILLAAVAVISASFSVFAGENRSSGKVIVYYFHGNFRCMNCRNFEQYSREAIEMNFKDELASGKLEFRVVNVEDRGNEHYGRDYQLYTKSLILSLVKEGKEVKWENLERIWEHVGSKDKFLAYVTTGISVMLKEAR
jgi:hypothetical protein